PDAGTFLFATTNTSFGSRAAAGDARSRTATNADRMRDPGYEGAECCRKNRHTSAVASILSDGGPASLGVSRPFPPGQWWPRPSTYTARNSTGPGYSSTRTPSASDTSTGAVEQPSA